MGFLKQTYKLTGISVSVLLSLVLLSLPVQPAFAAFSDTPLAGNTAFSGNVLASAPAADGSVYVGGSFSDVGVTAPYHYIYDTQSETTVSRAVPNGPVQASVSDENGGWYIGGYFNTIDNIATGNLAHILSDGSFDTGFMPNVTDWVSSLAFDSATHTLYVGGSFTTVNTDTTRNAFAAIDTTTGMVTSLDLNLEADTAPYVSSLRLNSDKTKIYVGGYFDSVNGGTTRNFLAAFSTTTGTATSFNPNMDSGVSAIVLSDDDSTLYAAGSFAAANGGTARHGVAAFNASTGTVTSFDPDLEDSDAPSTGISLVLDGSTLYVGGGFTEVNGGTVRNRLAAFNTTTGIATSFDPSLDSGYVYSLALDASTHTLYAAGPFYTASGNGVIAFDTTTSDTTDYSPRLSADGLNVNFNPTTHKLFVGGYFTSTNNMNTSLAHILSDGTLDLDFNPAVSGNVNALKLTADGSTLYLGGSFTSLNNGTTRNRLAAVSTSTGTATSFNPNISSSSVSALALSPNEATLYAGGGFTTVNGATTRNRLAAFSTSTGTATNFNPNISSSSVSALALNSNGTTLYAGGGFTSLNGGTTRNRLAAFDTSGTGTVNSFNPNMQSTVSALVVDGAGDLYAGGAFTTVGVTSRRALAHISTNGAGSLDGNFNAGIPSGNVNAISLNSLDHKLYIGGTFTNVNTSTARNRMAALDSTNGTANSFNPNSGGTISTLSLSSDLSKLYAGGIFSTMGSTTISNLAIFTDSVSNVDGDAALNSVEDGAPNNGDGNNDGTKDKYQANVTSFVDDVTGEYVTVVAPSGTTISSVSASAPGADEVYSYPFGLINFTITSVTPGSSNNISIYIPSDEAANSFTARKYINSTFSTIAGATVTSETIDGQGILHLGYSVIDGGTIDADGAANGSITDPVGLAIGDMDDDGIQDVVEDAAPNGGDANNDSTPDSEQSNVASIVNPVTNEYATLAVSEECTITSLDIIPESEVNDAGDADYNYPAGLMDFVLDCGTDGFTADINQYFFNTTGDFTLRKFKPDTGYFEVNDTTIAAETIGGTPATHVSYQVTDGQDLDTDNTENGIIEDPVGLAAAVDEGGSSDDGAGTSSGSGSGSDSNSDELASTGDDITILVTFAVLLLTTGFSIAALARRKHA